MLALEEVSGDGILLGEKGVYLARIWAGYWVQVFDTLGHLAPLTAMLSVLRSCSGFENEDSSGWKPSVRSSSVRT